VIRKVTSATPRAYQRTIRPLPGSGIRGISREATIGSRIAVVSQGKESRSAQSVARRIEIKNGAGTPSSALTHTLLRIRG
jgi:hypothetical protein